jgi:hypothetical protein
VVARLQQRADIAAERDQWLAWQQDCDVSKVVFLDEAGITTDLLRGYGRALGGIPACRDAAPAIGKP